MPSMSAGDAAKKFVQTCLAPRFFGDIVKARDALERILLSPQFPGTESLVRFLVEFDIRRVVEQEAELDLGPTPEIAPAEWLKSLGIESEKGHIGIFDEAFAEEFERKCLADFTGRAARMHPMVGFGCADPQADIAEWGRLLDDWRKEFREHYSKTGS